MNNTIVHRPWGTYQTILEEKNYLVKRIVVNPGQKLSLQYHHHRSEHWTVVQGTLTVVNGEKTFDLNRDQSTYIPITGKHRMINNTQEIAVVIEVQIGDTLAEEDIVRLEDTYGRVG
jgi:mannose-6-phosphate isomerase-like protein (cupin superfamily)